MTHHIFASILKTQGYKTEESRFWNACPFQTDSHYIAEFVATERSIRGIVSAGLARIPVERQKGVIWMGGERHTRAGWEMEEWGERSDKGGHRRVGDRQLPAAIVTAPHSITWRQKCWNGVGTSSRKHQTHEQAKTTNTRSRESPQTRSDQTVGEGAPHIAQVGWSALLRAGYQRPERE